VSLELLRQWACMQPPCPPSIFDWQRPPAGPKKPPQWRLTLRTNWRPDRYESGPRCWRPCLEGSLGPPLIATSCRGRDDARKGLIGTPSPNHSPFPVHHSHRLRETQRHRSMCSPGFLGTDCPWFELGPAGSSTWPQCALPLGACCLIFWWACSAAARTDRNHLNPCCGPLARRFVLELGLRRRPLPDRFNKVSKEGWAAGIEFLASGSWSLPVRRNDSLKATSRTLEFLGSSDPIPSVFSPSSTQGGVGSPRRPCKALTTGLVPGRIPHRARRLAAFGCERFLGKNNSGGHHQAPVEHRPTLHQGDV